MPWLGHRALVAILAVVAISAGLCWGQAIRPVGRPAPRKSDPNNAKPIPLVNVDEERAALVKKAQEFIQNKEYLKAIEYLQALAEKSEGKLVADDGKRFVSFAAKANEVIAGMGDEGLALYRRMYDPQAQQLYQQGLAQSDLGLLRQVSGRFANTTYGPKALNIIGSILFDGGRIEQASRSWRLALDRCPADDAERPMLLAKLYAAYHLSGQDAKAAEAAKELAAKHPDASIKVAGVEQKASQYIAAVGKMPPMVAPPTANNDEWAGLGAQKMGMGLMSESNVILSPRWQNPAMEGSKVPLVAMADLLRNNNNNGQRLTLSIKNGHVQATIGGPNFGNNVQSFTMPGLVQPVVVGDVVVYRRDDAVVACDLVTGEQRWITVNLPLERESKGMDRQFGGYYPYGNAAPGDTGRYTLTLADGKIFALANFRAPQQPGFNPAARQDPNAQGDTSELVALSVKGQLKQVWRQGGGAGKEDIVRGCRYLCAPAYEAGKVYSIVMYQSNYHLLCMDAQNGSLIWNAMICQAPALPANFGYQIDSMINKGSPPTVADGRVYVSTNAGVVAAFEADTGQPAWAYQYDSPYAMSNANPNQGFNGDPMGSMQFPPNPIIVAGSKVVCLPADSSRALILAADDGTLLAQVDRSAQHDLSAVDASRVLLSGPSLDMISLADGTRTRIGPPEAIMGRPAVTPTAILASGAGRLVRIDLQKPGYTYSVAPLVAGDEATGLLGNLISVRGQIIAANASGLCAYLNYADARARLSARIDAATPKTKPDLLLSRGQLAFSSRNYGEGLEDLLAAQESAAAAGRDMPRVQTLLYRTYVALGDHAEGEAMEKNFRKALACAQTPQEKGHMRIRLAKYYRLRAEQCEIAAAAKEHAGAAAEADSLRKDKTAQAVLAVQEAQDLREQFPAVDLADVEIGPSQDSVILGPTAEYICGARLGEGLIRELIQAYGQQVYDGFDTKAKTSLDQARSEHDANAMADIARRWPNSLWADSSRLLAAELLYRNAQSQTGDEAQATLAQVVPLISPLTADSIERSVRVNANVALAAVFARNGWRGAVNYYCDAARDAAGDGQGDGASQVAFGDLQGPLETMLSKLQGPRPEGAPRAVTQVATLSMPLTKIYDMARDNTCILRQQNLQPVRLGDRILLLSGNRAILADTQARDANAAVSWQGLSPMTSDALRQANMNNPSATILAALSKDQKVLMIASTEGLRGYELRTAKAKWSHTTGEIGVTGPCVMGAGDGVLAVVDSTGRVIVVDIATGEVLWNQVQLAMGNMMAAAPQVSGNLVMVRHAAGRQITLLDIAQKGRIVQTFQAGQSATGCFTQSGMALICTDNTLTALDPAQVAKPLWTRTLENNSNPAVLAVGADTAVIWANSRVEVYSVSGGKDPLVSLPLPTASNGQQLFPVQAAVDRNGVFLTCSLRQGNLRRPDIFQPLYGAYLVRVDLEKKKYAWVTELAPPSDLIVLPPTVAQSHVAVAVATSTNEGIVYVVDAATGKVATKIPTSRRAESDDAPRIQNGRPMTTSFGAPVITNGRLAIETSEGVVIYGNP